nr:iron-sulfur cluster co-chaperone protein HscB, mitochondrial isoform X1 [Ipomoea batatas]
MLAFQFPTRFWVLYRAKQDGPVALVRCHYLTLRTLFYRDPPLSSTLLPMPFHSRTQITIPFSSSSFHIQEASPSSVFQSQRLHLIRGNICFQTGKLFCSVSAEKFKCWNCNSVGTSNHPFLVCEACGSVQHVDQSIDYFQIFGLEKKYDIEGENLERKYKDWQRKLHPDLVHTKSEKEKEYAAEQSARVIDAYRTLTDSLSRAIYIAKLEGWNIDEEERILDPELLAEIMEIREAIEEAGDSQALKHIQAQIQEEFEEWSKSFAIAFENKDCEEAVSCIRRMTYYKRANEEIIKKL